MAPTLVQVIFAAALAGAAAVHAESHTIRFDNKCGRGTPTLILGGQIVSNGSDYTSVNPSGIAYLQTGQCLFNGENCALVEMTLGNPTCPGCGSSTDISLIAPHVLNVPTAFSYFDGCDGQGAACDTPTCSTAFFKSDDNQVQVACQEDNVNLLITFCGDSSAPPPSQPASSSAVVVPSSASPPASSSSPVASVPATTPATTFAASNSTASAPPSKSSLPPSGSAVPSAPGDSSSAAVPAPPEAGPSSGSSSGSDSGGGASPPMASVPVAAPPSASSPAPGDSSVPAPPQTGSSSGSPSGSEDSTGGDGASPPATGSSKLCRPRKKRSITAKPKSAHRRANARRLHV